MYVRNATVDQLVQELRKPGDAYVTTQTTFGDYTVQVVKGELIDFWMNKVMSGLPADSETGHALGRDEEGQLFVDRSPSSSRL